LIFPTTPSQTVGPFFAIGMPWDTGPYAVPEGTPGAIRIAGTVYDGAGLPVPDSMIETWQCDPDGRFADLHGYGEPSQLAGFRGFARFAAEDGDGRFEIVTVKPGPLPGRVGGSGVSGVSVTMQAPHIDVSVFARGMLHRCVTRIYFADEAEANAADPVLASVSAERRSTLLAQPVEGGYQIDIHLQGEGETVFFAV
jgi:protocatechuate 3,4-dioxygenase, alpha subunit